MTMDTKKIAKLRARTGWTQAQMADAIGCVKMVISHWETGFREPKGTSARFLELLYSLSDSDLKRITKILETLGKENSDA